MDSDNRYIKEGSDNEGFGMHWYPLVEPEKNGWAIELQDSRYGYLSFLRGSAKKAVISSGHDYIYIP